MNTALLVNPRSISGTYRRYDRGVRAVPPDTQQPDLDRAFASGRADLREVYDNHGALVYSICRRSLSDESAKDVAQEVFVSAWRARDRFDPSRGTLAAWLVGITKRRIIDHLRHERRHADRRADESAATPTDTEPGVERIADRMLIADGLRTLPDSTRECVELAFIHDLTHQEIADRTGTPLGTVKSNIRRGLLRIREHMESTHA